MIIKPDSDELPPNIQTLKRRMAPASTMMGLEFLEADLDEGWARVSFQPTDQFLNPWGAVQGGLLAAMLDEVMGVAMGLYCDWGQVMATLELKVNLLMPAQPGPIIGEGRVIKQGKSVFFAEGKLRDLDDDMIATASTTARLITIKRDHKSDDCN